MILIRVGEKDGMVVRGREKEVRRGGVGTYTGNVSELIMWDGWEGGEGGDDGEISSRVGGVDAIKA